MPGLRIIFSTFAAWSYQEQETNSLRHIRDGFPKIIITGGLTPSYVNEDGISVINVIDFLKDKE